MIVEEERTNCLWCGHDLQHVDDLFCSGICERMWLSDDKI